MFDKLGDLASEHAELERALADPGVHADADQARTLAKRYAELTPIVNAYREWQQTSGDEQAARELAQEDSAFADEADALAKQREELEERLRKLLVPKDPNDDRDTIVEVKAGEGGEESALFAGEPAAHVPALCRAARLEDELIDSTLTGLGGVKDATMAVKAWQRGTGAWSRLKYEGGVHRVQRVPGHGKPGPHPHLGRGRARDAGGRPGGRAGQRERPAHRRVPVKRPGGQSVNTTDSAVRITHLPTGIVVSCQNEKSQLQNKEQALRVLRSRLLAAAEEEANAKASAERKAQVRTVDRSERVRTYNFPENRINDHRVGYKAYNLDQVIDGDLDAVIDALAAADLEAKLTEQ